MTGQPAQQPSAATSRQTQQASTPQAPQSSSARPVVASRTTGAQQPQSTTPRLLRFARAAAAAAALLTGLVATGTFSTDGVNATPNVVVDDWVAAERAGVLVAEAEQLGAARVADGDTEEDRAAFDEVVVSAGRDLGSLGESAGDPGGAWSAFVVEAERAATTAGYGGSEAAAAYQEASAAADQVRTEVTGIAERHAADLGAGSSSGPTATVGSAATLVLIGIMVVVALRTRRILNVPLLVATLITAGLTYVSANPSALPLSYDEQLQETAATATALQEIHDARAAQYAESLGTSSDWESEAGQATDALGAVGDPELAERWEAVAAASADATGLADSQADVDEITSTLQEQLDGELQSLASDVGAPALITAGAALLLGLVASVLAWTGITRRLQDYR